MVIYETIDTWIQMRELGTHIDTDAYESVIYKGLKMVRYASGGEFQFLCTASDLYKPVSDDVIYAFEIEGFESGMKTYLKEKYLKQLVGAWVSEKEKKIIRQKLKSL